MLNKVSKDDWQYSVPFLVCTICFIASDVFGILNKPLVAYWSGRMLIEPYRIITSHFFHGSINHLLANISGIFVARYFLKALGLRSDYFLFIIIAFLIPLQTFIYWGVDILVFKNSMSLAIGFSGILFGIDAFILMTTIFGKKRFLFIECEMNKNHKLFKSILLLTGIGFCWSFLPGISLLGHTAGFMAGFLLFWL